MKKNHRGGAAHGEIYITMTMQRYAGLMLAALLPIAAQASETLSPQEKRMRLREGVAQIEQKNAGAAIQTFQTLLPQYGVIEEYLRYFLAQAYVGDAKYQEALAELEQIRRAFPTSPICDDAQWLAANALMKLQRPADALAEYQALASRATTIAQGDLLYGIGQAAMQAGNAAEAVAALHRLMTQFPGHPQAKDAERLLKKLVAANPPLAPQLDEHARLSYANALLSARLYKAAIQQFMTFQQQYPSHVKLKESQLGLADATLRAGKTTEGAKLIEELAAKYAASDPEFAAKALYTLGMSAWQADRNQDAQQQMERLVNTFSNTSWSDNALYVLGRIAETQRDYQRAARQYARLTAQHPDSDYAEEAGWRAGWAHYQAAQYDRAADVFSRVLAAFPAGDYVEAGIYWKGRALESAGQLPEAIPAYRQLLRNPPETYYSLLARERLRNAGEPLPARTKQNGTHPKIADVAQQARAACSPAFFQDVRIRLPKIMELRAADLSKYARREVEWLRARLEQDAPADEQTRVLRLYFLARLYEEAGDYLKGIQIAADIETALKTLPSAAFPYSLNRLAYPLEYWELIKTQAAAQGLDPFLVAGVIRQESTFDPKNISPAGARGLMQVMPDTGKRVAKRLGLKNYSAAQLYAPDINVRIGAAYLAEMLQKFNGDLFRAIAAYNAGPIATEKWWPAQSGIASEQVIENITYKETRNYVKRVMRNQANYRLMYPELRPAGR